MNCKRQQLGNRENAFIREVTGPELRAVLGFDWQLKDIVRFYTNSSKFAVFGVDPTFNLGKFHHIPESPVKGQKDREIP